MVKRGFGELEFAVLKIFKDGKKRSVKEVHTLLGETNKYTTVMTVMVRLNQKKLLHRERVGLHYIYWASSLEANSSSFFKQLQSKLFGIKPIEMVNYLLDSEDISDEELNEMENILRQAKEKKSKKC